MASALLRGARLDAGKALAIAGTTVATIALPAGQVLEMQTLVEGDPVLSACHAVRAGVALWVVCKVQPRGSGDATMRVYQVRSGSPLTITPLDWSKRAIAPRVLRGGKSGALLYFDTEEAVVLSATARTPLTWPSSARPHWPDRGARPVWMNSADHVVPLSTGPLVFLRTNRADDEVATLATGGTETMIARVPDGWRPIRLLAEDDPDHLQILGWPRSGTPQLATVALSSGELTIDTVPGLSCPNGKCRWQLELNERTRIALRVALGVPDTGPLGPGTDGLRPDEAALTRDGGRRWSPLGVPRAALEKVPSLLIPGVGFLTLHAHANEVGMVVGRMARIGWEVGDDGATGEEARTP